MTTRIMPEWNGAIVRTWLEARIVAAKSDQVAAERGGRGEQDDCDKATAEDMVCTLMLGKYGDGDGEAAADRAAFTDMLRVLLDRDEYVWRGVYDDTRFDRHVRAYLRKLVKMAKTNEGFERTGRYQ